MTSILHNNYIGNPKQAKQLEILKMKGQ